ncbi:MAG: hypothetical protein LUC31_02585 [Coprobacillus sp.]|nr:hypothetical protein [Coprobacillus sp.]
MKKFSKLIISLSCVCICSLSGCSGATVYGSPKKTRELSYEEEGSEAYLEVLSALDTFGMKFASCCYQGTSTNVAISPLSLYSALALAACCASSQTRDEILSALGVDYSTLVSGYEILYNDVTEKTYSNKGDLRSELDLTNSLWLQKDLEVNKSTVKELSNNFYTYTQGVDFNGNNTSANNEITKFIKKHTHSLIERDFDFDVSTLFVLLNTLYLKDVWREEGNDISSYGKKTFTQGDGTTVSVPLYYRNYITGKPYEGTNFTSFYASTYSGYRLTFIKPNEGYTVSEIYSEETFNEAMNATYIRQDDTLMERYNTRSIFPEFSASYDSDVSGILKSEFGINDLFSETNCDMSNLTDSHVYCSKVEHVTQLEVTKKGIEGSAVSILDMAGSGATVGEYTEVYFDFILDHAFMYVLTAINGEPLFMGVVNTLS